MMILYNSKGDIVGEIYEDKSIVTTRDKLGEIFYEASEDNVDEFYAIFSEFANVFNISTEVQENYFLAQIVAETGYDLISKRENLNYSCDSLKKIFSRYKSNPKWADRDGRCNGHPANQVNIGNVAYADRIGNGPIESGDGYVFRGGGYFQLTGRANYARMSEVILQTIGEVIGAESLAREITEVRVGLLSAMAFWLDNRCYECDHIHCVTEKVNKYTDSYDKRKDIYLWIVSV